jgi:penicillin-binding protein 1A
VLHDRPVQIGDWEPQNASGQFKGAVHLKSAFAQSINTIAVQLADEIGVPPIIETAKRLGVQSNLPAVPSLALGTADPEILRPWTD